MTSEDGFKNERSATHQQDVKPRSIVATIDGSLRLSNIYRSTHKAHVQNKRISSPPENRQNRYQNPDCGEDLTWGKGDSVRDGTRGTRADA